MNGLPLALLITVELADKIRRLVSKGFGRWPDRPSQTPVDGGMTGARPDDEHTRNANTILSESSISAELGSGSESGPLTSPHSTMYKYLLHDSSTSFDFLVRSLKLTA